MFMVNMVPNRNAKILTGLFKRFLWKKVTQLKISGATKAQISLNKSEYFIWCAVKMTHKKISRYFVSETDALNDDDLEFYVPFIII